MQRYFFELAYDGTPFFGWQRQPREVSVQQCIEEAMTKLNSNNAVKIVGCGRTDTGVHAHHYIFHVDLPTIEDREKYVFKLNSMLPDSIAVARAISVDESAHARFDATRRTYRYFIHDHKDPFRHAYSWNVLRPLDLEKMNEAAKHLLGKQDFTSLSKLHTDVKTNFCDIFKAEWHSDDTGIYFEITADRFLRNMVRATVGTLVEIGLGKLQTSDMQRILEAKDRQAASSSAPAHGLFLWKIEYPKQLF